MGIIIFIFNIILAINFITETSIQSLSEKVDLTLYLKDNVTNTQVEKIVNETKLLDGVVNVEFTSKEEALQKIKASYPNIYESYEKYDLKNPLPASVSIRTKSPDYHQSIEDFFKGSSLSAHISNINASEQNSDQEKSIISSVAKNLKKITDISHQIIFWLIIIFITGGTLIMFNTIQMTIHDRRKEINIMRLVGARIAFIHLPFIIEAVIYAILAVLFNIVLLVILSNQISIEGITLQAFSKNLNLTSLTIFELIITIILAICSSTLAVHNYLKKPVA